jgi:chromosome segregation ATPase
MQGYSSFEEMEKYSNNSSFFTGANIFIAAMPFFMVALVEITKIPFVGAFYQAKSLLWRIIFGLTICFMAAITFESAANGFERNFNALIFGINDFKRKLASTEERISNLDEQRDRLSKLSLQEIETDFREKFTQLSKARSIEAKAVSTRKSELRASIETETLANLRSEIKQKNNRITKLENDKQDAISNANDYYESLLKDAAGTSLLQIRNLQSILQRKNRELETLTARSYQEIEKASIFTQSRVTTDWQKKLDKKDVEISDLEAEIKTFDNSTDQEKARTKFDGYISSINTQYNPQLDEIESERRQLASELSQSIGTKEKDIQERVNRLNTELAVIEERFNTEGIELKSQKEEAVNRFSSNSDRIDSVDETLDDLNQERLELREEINLRVGNNQVYRMAQSVYGKEQAADINRKQVTFIASIWFGSLAVLIALTGIMLALASYVLSDESDKNKSIRKYRINLLAGRLIQSLRRYSISKRRTQKLPIIKEVPREIIQEVEVSRVVTVEKPVEIKIREIVYVPLYTNDKSLLNLSSKGSLDDIEDKTKKTKKTKISLDEKAEGDWT